MQVMPFRSEPVMMFTIFHSCYSIYLLSCGALLALSFMKVIFLITVFEKCAIVNSSSRHLKYLAAVFVFVFFLQKQRWLMWMSQTV